MPRDNNPASVGPAFENAATPVNETSADDMAAEPLDFQSTVSSQIDLEIERYDALDAHDTRWNKERDRLMAKPVEAPALGPDGDASYSAQRRYNERRASWEAHRDAINGLFDNQIDALRSQGTTLTDGFDASHGSPSQTPSDPDPTREQRPDNSAAPDNGDPLAMTFLQRAGRGRSL
ncbi:MAG: hypothetical protein H6907_09975 [Hyphomicrobiales bacterium]|nr:hypothetical protein [Hyphomicrobiales bacterium]MCP5372046.1 hypothetical protein [Hyphomicrobiales bacterium]